MAEGGRVEAAQRFEQLLAAGKDGALLRFALGHEYLNAGNTPAAIPHLRRAVDLDPGYSAAWKLLGKALTAENRIDEALLAYERGIAAAIAKGDKQAQKEMQVFARRLAKARAPE